MNYHQTADADQEWRDEQAARRDYILDRAKDMPPRCWQEWCDDYNVSLGICIRNRNNPYLLSAPLAYRVKYAIKRRGR